MPCARAKPASETCKKNESIFQVSLAHNSTASLREVVISSCRPLMWWLSHIIKLSEVFHVPPHRRFAFARARHSRERFIVLFHDGKTFHSLSSSIITISRNDLNFKKSNEVKTMVDFYLKIEFPSLYCDRSSSPGRRTFCDHVELGQFIKSRAVDRKFFKCVQLRIKLEPM